MNFFGCGRKERTTFFCIVANGDHKIKIDIAVLINIIRGVMRNVNAIFFHYFNCPGIYTVRFYSCAVNLRFFSGEVFQVTFCHLASATVTCAKRQYFFLCHIYTIDVTGSVKDYFMDFVIAVLGNIFFLAKKLH